MKFTSQAYLLAPCLLCTANTFAEDSEWYIHTSALNVNNDYDYKFFNSSFQGQQGTSTGYAIGFGKKLRRNLAIEFNYYNYGEIDSHQQKERLDEDTFKFVVIDYQDTQSIQAASVEMKYSHALNEWLSGVAKGGSTLGYSVHEESDTDDRDTAYLGGITLGVGLEGEVTQDLHWQVSYHYDRLLASVLFGSVHMTTSGASAGLVYNL